MRILVIEDNHRLNSSLASSLTHEGYSVDSAYDGQEGQDLAEMTAYDLILLDILLPVKDGLEVCRDLRRRRVHTPILLLTARDSVDDRVRGLDLSDIALASVERLLPLARQSQVALATGGLPEVLVRGDPQYLGRLLTNLIENGIKYTGGIGKRVSVELSTEQQRWGVVRVQDDGPGISEEYLPWLFERFYRVDRARSRGQKGITQTTEPGGSGLGLSIAYWIVQAHGGQIRVESKIGVGSLFEVRLPLLNKREARGEI